MKRLIAILFFIAFASVARADGPLLLHGVLTPNNCLVAISANTVEDGGFVCAGGAGGPFLPLSGGTMIGTLGFADGTSWGSSGIIGSLAVSGSVTTGNGGIVIGKPSGFVAFNQAANGDITTVASGRIGFVPSTNPTVSPDTAITRASANVLAIGNGTPGDFSGTIKATGFNSGNTAGVSCGAGTVSLTTFTVTNGIVTHC